MGIINTLFAHSFENEDNVCRVAAQVYDAGPCKAVSKISRKAAESPSS